MDDERRAGRTRLLDDKGAEPRAEQGMGQEHRQTFLQRRQMLVGRFGGVAAHEHQDARNRRQARNRFLADE